MSKDEQEPGDSLTGRSYRLDGIKGKGAFGTVYRAEYLGEEGFTRQVAIKVLNPDRENFADIARRLRDEARLLGLLRHRAIVHVDGLVFLDGRWSVVMEYIDGVDLGALLDEGSLPIGPALEVVGEVAGALNVAYWTRGKSGEPLRLLHRDIKPSNILLTPAGEVKVVDFGVARAEFTSRESDTVGTRFGSLGYMSPERLEFIDGPEGDVYALGAVLYELLAGQPLGRTSVHPGRHAKRINDAMRDLHKEKPKLSTGLKGFLATMLEYEPERRPTAREVETRCREFRGGLGGTWLREWAEAQVPGLVKVHDLDSNLPESKRVLAEQIPTEGTPIAPTLDSFIEYTSAAEETPTASALPEREFAPPSLSPEANPTIVFTEDMPAPFEPPSIPPEVDTVSSISDIRGDTDDIVEIPPEPESHGAPELDPRVTYPGRERLPARPPVVPRRDDWERMLPYILIAIGVLSIPLVMYLLAMVLFRWSL